MADISAAQVRAFRERTGLPLMDCKRALEATGGDEDAAIEQLRREGEKLAERRGDRETTFGRFGLHFGLDKSAGAIVELKCESAPVTQNAEFIQLANDMASALAASGGVASVDELLALPSPSKPGQTLGDQRSELFNRIREVFNVGRFARVEGATGGYSHNATTVSGVLLVIEGGSDQAAKDVSMHVAACNPVALSKEEIDPTVVEKEREILRAAALNEGKPENIVDKMVEGRLRSFFAEKALLEQPFVKDNAVTVSKYAEDNGMKIKQFIHWELGRE